MGAFAHICHLIMTIIFLPWLVVWVGCAVSAGNRKHKEEMDLLRQLIKEKQ